MSIDIYGIFKMSKTSIFPYTVGSSYPFAFFRRKIRTSKRLPHFGSETGKRLEKQDRAVNVPPCPIQSIIRY